MIIGGRLVRLVIVCVALIGLIGLLYPSGANAESLGQLLSRQADLRRQADENKKKLEQTKGQVSDLTGIVGGLDQDIAETQANITNTEAQIAVTEQVISELAVDIDQTQTELDGLQLKLRNAYISLYELSQESPLDSILASSSLTQIVSQSQYIQSLQTELQGNIDKTNAAKAELEGKKNESVAQKEGLVSLKQDLTKSKNALNNRRGQKAYLLAQTQGQQAQYEALLKQIQREASQISDQIYRQRQASGGFVNQSGTGGYPWSSEPDTECNSKADPWGYCFRQCTSYAAWRYLQIHGVPLYNTRPGSGSAYNWPALATDPQNGFSVQVGGTPQVGDAVSWNRPLFAGDLWGHVAIVEQVYSSNDIVVSEYNWIKLSYSERRINPSIHGQPRYIRP